MNRHHGIFHDITCQSDVFHLMKSHGLVCTIPPLWIQTSYGKVAHELLNSLYLATWLSPILHDIEN